ncbi:MAG: glycosyl transferase [Planctomycetes bacterium RBG_16_64_12]|nr:MAG: glycosyl transferase [Planctomycetes bacterium RBG_16_64_12]
MISIVVPCYNEKEVLDELYQRLSRAAESWEEPFEVIVVDDGSDEETWQRIEAVHRRDPRWKAVRFSRNFGHQTAVSAGIARAAGRAVIVLDADLQDPPEELHRFLAKWREGYEVVYGLRRKRKEGPLKRLCYHLFYRILAGTASQPIPADSGDFCLMDRRVVDLLNAMPERNRFVRGLRAWVGFRQIGVEYPRDARRAGKPKYTLSKLIRLAVDGLFSFSTVPLRLATYLGLAVSTIAFLGAVFTLVQRLFADWFDSIGLGPVPGFATIVIAILFLGGVQLICLGIMGEYIGRIYDEVKGRPSWIVRQTLGWESADRDAEATPANPEGENRDQETG